MILTDAQVSELREDYVSETMFDTAKIGLPVGGGPGTQSPKPTSFVYGEEFACGVKETDAREVLDGSQKVLVDAVIRVPTSSSPPVGARILVTKRHGIELATSQLYAILGFGLEGVGFRRLNCRRITEKSTL